MALNGYRHLHLIWNFSCAISERFVLLRDNSSRIIFRLIPNIMSRRRSPNRNQVNTNTSWNKISIQMNLNLTVVFMWLMVIRYRGRLNVHYQDGWLIFSPLTSAQESEETLDYLTCLCSVWSDDSTCRTWCVCVCLTLKLLKNTQKKKAKARGVPVIGLHLQCQIITQNQCFWCSLWPKKGGEGGNRQLMFLFDLAVFSFIFHIPLRN